MSFAISTNEDDFCSLDDDKGWPRFMIALLRLGSILTKNDESVREISDIKVCRLMAKYSNQIHHIFQPKELRTLVEYECPDLRGGGIRVEWTELTEGRMCRKRRYYFNFDRIYRPEEVRPNVRPPDESTAA